MSVHRISPLHRHSRRKGFTLVELMVVIVIIGLLAGIVAVNVVGMDEEAKKSKAKAECEAIYSAIGIYKLENGDYPEQLEQLMENEKNKKYLSGYSQVPKDPWGNEYVYNTDSIETGEYIITCYGKDGQPGGTGDAADISHPAQAEEGSSNN